MRTRRTDEATECSEKRLQIVDFPERRISEAKIHIVELDALRQQTERTIVINAKPGSKDRVSISPQIVRQPQPPGPVVPIGRIDGVLTLVRVRDQAICNSFLDVGSGARAETGILDSDILQSSERVIANA